MAVEYQAKPSQTKSMMKSIFSDFASFIAGGVWPPYPGANQGYWARQAGFYDNLPAFSKPKSLRTPAIINQSSSTLTPSIFSTNLTTQLPTPKTRPHNNSPFSLPTLFRPIQVLLGRRQVPWIKFWLVLCTLCGDVRKQISVGNPFHWILNSHFLHIAMCLMRHHYGNHWDAGDNEKYCWT